MIAVVQRVSEASVTVNREITGSIGPGLVILLGVFNNDEMNDAQFLAEKCCNLRIFADEAGNMNLSLLETGGEILAVSQFTLCANARKGRRPSFVAAMAPEPANELYESFCEEMRKTGINVETGVFGATMSVKILNDGPVTIILDSRESRRGNIK